MSILEEKEGFFLKFGEIAGDRVGLYTPKPDVEWDATNLQYRSLILNECGEIVSIGFKRFFNLLECQELDSWVHSWPVSATEKHDGSLLIVSNYKGEIIHRTRGTFCATNLENGAEIEFLKKKYPSVFDVASPYSYLYEWETPSNRIVLEPPKEPTLTLIGAISHDTLSYVSHEKLDRLAQVFEVARPKYYNFDSLEECVETVKDWKGAEGVVINSPNNQVLRKIKAEEYLRAHYLLTQLNTNGILELMAAKNFPDREKFFAELEKEFDYEVVTWIRADVGAVYDKLEEVQKEMADIANWVSIVVAQKENRKEQAETILSKYDGWKKQYAFMKLDGREFDAATLKKILKNDC